MTDRAYSGQVVALAGGVGGARLAAGLAMALPPGHLTVIVNTGDDFEHLGLKICPDLDTVSYTLAGLSNPETGWGRAGESWTVFENLEKLGAPTWFRLGDKDLSTHLERTRRLKLGEPLSQVTREFCRVWGVEPVVVPMSDDSVPTWVYTEEGDLPFQEYFVHQGCRPRVRGFRFEGVQDARPAPGVLESLRTADILIICPSNPWVSIDPILAVPGIRAAVEARRASDSMPVLAVSPIIGGKTVKGPAAKMYGELGIQPSALAVARHYRTLLSGFVLDSVDAHQAEAIIDLGIQPLVTETLMKGPEDRRRLATELLTLAPQSGA